MKYFYSCVYLIFFQVVVLGYEYEKPNKIDVSITPNITYQTNNGNFIYEYTVFSSDKSLQEIKRLRIFSPEPVSNVKSPYGWMTSFYVTVKPNPKWPKNVHWFAFYAADDPRGKIIPNHGNVSPSPNQIKPGQSLSGFSYEGVSLPGIVVFHAEGFVPLTRFSGSVPKDYKKRNLLEDNFQGKTIGPVAVTDTSVGRLIDRLITLKDETPKYNWITNQGILNSLNVKLNAAKESIAKSNNKTASNQLNAFINELDAQKGKQVNENAWALLRANAEYLISKLGE